MDFFAPEEDLIASLFSNSRVLSELMNKVEYVDEPLLARRGTKRSCQEDSRINVPHRLKRYYEDTECDPNRFIVLVKKGSPPDLVAKASPRFRTSRPTVVSEASLSQMISAASEFRCPTFEATGEVCNLPAGTSGFCPRHSTAIQWCKSIIEFICSHVEASEETPLCSKEDVEMLQRTVAGVYASLSTEQKRELAETRTEVRLTCNELVKKHVADRRWTDAQKKRHCIYIYGDRVVADAIHALKTDTCSMVTRRLGRCSKKRDGVCITCDEHKPYFLHAYKLLVAILKRVQ